MSNEFAAKADLTALESKLIHEIDQVRLAILETSRDTIKWVIGIVGFQTVALIGAAFGCAHFSH